MTKEKPITCRFALDLAGVKNAFAPEQRAPRLMVPCGAPKPEIETDKTQNATSYSNEMQPAWSLE